MFSRFLFKKEKDFLAYFQKTLENGLKKNEIPKINKSYHITVKIKFWSIKEKEKCTLDKEQRTAWIIGDKMCQNNNFSNLTQELI